MLSNTTNTLAQYAPWLVAIFAKSTLLILVALAAAKLMRRASASLRHFLYVLTIAGALILPLAAALLPSLGLAVLPHRQTTRRAEAVVQSSSQPAEAPVTNIASRPHPRPSRAEARPKLSRENTTSQNEPMLATTLKPAVDEAHRLNQMNWQGALVLAWIAGCAIFMARIAAQQLRLRRLINRAVPVQSIVLASRLRWLCRDLGIRREVVLLASEELDVPIAAGVLDPKIVLSPQCGEWSETRRNAVLCHEIAHIKRFDALTQFVASLAAAMYWFNPFVWLIVRDMRAERERACDDYVLASGTAPSEYAHELLEIVSTLVRPQPAAALAMARRSQLEGRVLALVNPRVRHGALTAGVAMVLSSAVFAVALPLSALKLQERPAQADAPRLANSSTTPQPAPAPISHAFVTTAPDISMPANEQVSNIGIPVYPNAVAGDHVDGRGTVSLVDGAHVHRLAAGAYFSNDDAEKVVQFYRDRLRSYGRVIECSGGRNTRVDVQLNNESLADPQACRSGDFADGGTELKVTAMGDERIVVVRPYAKGSEIALVRLPAGMTDVDSDRAQRNQVISSSPECEDGHSSSSTSNSHTDDNGLRTWTATWSRGACSIEARSSGTVRFNADATAIEGISSSGYFEVSERIGDTLRRVRVDSGSNGQLTYTYKLNGSQQEFDATARAWFSNLLVRLERVTGFAADTRVPALLRKGGPQAVLDEITQLESDYVRQVYFTKLFENATLPAPMLVKALDQARNEISTDYSLAQVLLTIAEKYDLKEEAQRVAFLNAASKLRTDYEHSRVLIQLLKRPDLSPQLVRGALESAKTIHTDYEKSRILTTLAGLNSFDESEISTYLDLTGSISTDYEHSRSLMALMEHHKLSTAAVTQILKSASTINTDYEKSRVLLALSGSNSFDEKQIATYLTLVDSIGTDYERSRTLLALMQQHKLGSEAVAQIIAETQKIGTDYEKARVLTEAAGRYQLQGSVRDAYIKAANSIGTEYERNRTLAAITKREVI